MLYVLLQHCIWGQYWVCLRTHRVSILTLATVTLVSLVSSPWYWVINSSFYSHQKLTSSRTLTSSPIHFLQVLSHFSGPHGLTFPALSIPVFLGRLPPWWMSLFTLDLISKPEPLTKTQVTQLSWITSSDFPHLKLSIYSHLFLNGFIQLSFCLAQSYRETYMWSVFPSKGCKRCSINEYLKWWNMICLHFG